MTIKSKAKLISESIKEIMHESTVTTTNEPDFDKIKDTVLVKGTKLNMPNPPHISTVDFDGHQYTVMDAKHPQAPPGMKDSVTSTTTGIEHIKAMVSTVK